MISSNRHGVLWILCSVVLATGCTGNSGDELPETDLDASVVAAAIMSEYDADGDGEVSQKELKKNVGLAKLTIRADQMAPEYRLDSDENGSVSQEEFQKKFQALFADRRMSYSCKVIYKGRPLEGATVTLVPESFMTGVPQASGETNEEGLCGVTGEDGVGGAVPGIYRLEITHPDKKIAAKYNTESKEIVAVDSTNPYGEVGTPEIRIR